MNDESKPRGLDILSTVIESLISDVAMKDAANRAVDALEEYVSGVLLKVNELDRRVKVLEESIRWMVEARVKLGVTEPPPK